MADTELTPEAIATLKKTGQTPGQLARWLDSTDKTLFSRVFTEDDIVKAIKDNENELSVYQSKAGGGIYDLMQKMHENKIPFTPKIVDAISEGKTHHIATALRENPEKVFDKHHYEKYLANMEHTEDGKPVSQETIQKLQNHSPDDIALLNKLWDENHNKDFAIYELARDKNVDSETLEKIHARALRNHPASMGNDWNAPPSNDRWGLDGSGTMHDDTMHAILTHPNVTKNIVDKEIESNPRRVAEAQDLTASPTIKNKEVNHKLLYDMVNHMRTGGAPIRNKVKHIVLNNDLDPNVLDELYNNEQDQSIADDLAMAKDASEGMLHKHYDNNVKAYNKYSAASDTLKRNRIPPSLLHKIIDQNSDGSFDSRNVLNEIKDHYEDNHLTGGFDSTHEQKLLDLDPDNFTEIIARRSHDPNIIRNAWKKGQEHDIYTVGSLTKNYHTPSDVLLEASKTPGGKDILSRFINHPNFPDSAVQELHKDKNHPLWHEANTKLMASDPDQYAGQQSVEVKNVPHKLRAIRDSINEKDPVKGEVKPKELGQGIFNNSWKPVQEANGNVSSKKIQEHIDKAGTTRYNVSETKWSGAQRHSDNDQKVFQLNATTDHIKQMKEAGVYGTYKNLLDKSSAGHPANESNGIGWLRYEEHAGKPNPDCKSCAAQSAQTGRNSVCPDCLDKLSDSRDSFHVDEIQTDMGPNTFKQLKERSGIDKHGINPAHFDAISHILYGGKHPSEAILEAFKEHKRSQGHHDRDIHILDAKTKAPISGMREGEALPAHMNFTYNQMPKKMGMKPAKYGETLDQNNPEHFGSPTWKDKIRKSEELLSKALDDIKVGPETIDYDQKKQKKIPNVLKGARHVYDYGHLLSSEQKQKGYKLYIRDHGHELVGKLYHKNNLIGTAEGSISHVSPEKMHIHITNIEEKHRNKGLGMPLYESMLAHAKHVNKVTHVVGGDHSTAAHRIHQKVSEKHGLSYTSLPSYLGESYRFKDQAEWEAAANGPFDDKWGKYEYMLKSEDGIIAMLEQPNSIDRHLALKSAKILPHHLLMALTDEDPSIRMAAALHPKVNEPLLTEMVRQCNDSAVCKTLLNRPESTVDQIHLAMELHPEWFGED